MQILFTYLPSRAGLSISGPERHDFLQKLVTNDITPVKEGKLVYACLLTPQGKFLFDFFIREDNDMLVLDCEGGERAQALLKKLRLYKLHSDVTLELQDTIDVFVSFESLANGYQDSRHPQMGWRSYTKPDAEEMPFEGWDTQRIKLCVPDGSLDMVIEKSTLLECRIDTLNGVDFKKGCYVGQEVTARMHYRGLAKKHLYAIEFKDTPPQPYTDIMNSEGRIIGEMRSSCGSYGIALLKDEAITNDLPFSILQ